MALNALSIFQTGREYAAKVGPTRAYLNRIHDFVERHRGEPDLSFRIVRHPPEDEVCVMIKAKGREYWYLSDVLFGRHTQTAAPKYVLDGGGPEDPAGPSEGIVPAGAIGGSE